MSVPEPQDRERVAPGIRRVHTRECARSRGTRKRCSCEPSYEARAKTGTRQRSRELSATFRTLAEATKWREDTLAGIEGRRTGPTPTIGEGAESFMHRARSGGVLAKSGKAYKSSTLDGHESALRNHILPVTDPASGLPLSDLPADRLLSPRALRMVVGQMHEKGASDATVRRSMAALRAVLAYLYNGGYVDTPPPTVTLPPPPKPRDRVYTPEERAALYEAAELEDATKSRSLLAPLIALLDATGLRITEALELRWGPDGVLVGAEGGVVRVRESKTATGVREIPVGPRLAGVLTAHRNASGGVEGGPLFAHPNTGGPYRRHGAPRYALRRAAAFARVDDVGWHAFRHTSATNLGTRSDVDAVTLAGRLGHGDAAFTQRTYIHAQDEAAIRLGLIADDLLPRGPDSD